MKDKRQRMALTWPYANPHLAAYMFAAAATAAAYGQPAAMYWNRAAVAAAAATAPSAPYPAPGQPYHQHLMARPPTGATAPGEFLNSAPMPDSAMLDSIGHHSASSGCCTSPLCHGCSSPTNLSPLTHSPTSVSSFKPLTSSSPEMTTKKLFQPYKNDLDK